ncbi:MAG: hypothetical protein U1F48_14485 [Burkholderiales bacterium]
MWLLLVGSVIVSFGSVADALPFSVQMTTPNGHGWVLDPKTQQQTNFTGKTVTIVVSGDTDQLGTAVSTSFRFFVSDIGGGTKDATFATFDGGLSLFWELIPFADAGIQAQGPLLAGYKFQSSLGPAPISAYTFSRLPTSGHISLTLDDGRGMALAVDFNQDDAAVIEIRISSVGPAGNAGVAIPTLEWEAFPLLVLLIGAIAAIQGRGRFGRGT